jgi:regulator of sirC expression with transglutaminase-like and TPR domain
MRKRIKSSTSQSDQEHKAITRQREATWPMLLLVLTVVASIFLIKKRSVIEHVSPAVNANRTFQSPIQHKQPVTLAELTNLPPSQLEHCDIGLMNLLCAQGLRGSEDLDIANCSELLDNLARRVASETDRHFYRFRNNPTEYNHSEAEFRILMLAVVLYEDFQVRYNTARITMPGVFESNDTFFADARDVFIHGLLQGKRTGTCASMPVLYVAVGRRLGYPLKLVPAKAHLFVRWEDGRVRFNIEATGRGFTPHDDDYYRRWPLSLTPDEEKEMGFLKSMSAAEELATFFTLRGASLTSTGRYEEAIASHEQAVRLTPASKFNQIILTQARRDVASRTASREVLGLPLELQPNFRPPPGKAIPTLSSEPNPIRQLQSQ